MGVLAGWVAAASLAVAPPAADARPAPAVGEGDVVVLDAAPVVASPPAAELGAAGEGEVVILEAAPVPATPAPTEPGTSAPAQPASPPARAGDEGEVVILDGGPTPPAAGGPPDVRHTWVQRELDARLLADTTFHHDGENVLELWTLGRLRLDHRASRAVKAVVEARARWGVAVEDTAPGTPFLGVNGRDPSWVAVGELREAYLDWRQGSFGLRAGEQIFVWGKNEVLAGADVLSPPDLRWDPTRGLTDPRSVRQPVLALDAGWWPGDLGVELVLVPLFTPARVPLVGSDFAIARPGSSTARQLELLRSYAPRGVDTLAQGFLDAGAPSPSVANVSAALRVSGRLGGADLAATVYRGYDPIPAVTLDPSLRVLLDNADRLRADPALAVVDPVLGAALATVAQRSLAGAPLASSSYERLYVVALEGQLAAGDLLVRGDFSWSPERTYYTEALESFDAPELRGALGVEYTRGETWYAALTAFGLGLLHPPAEPVLGIDGATAGTRDAAVRWGFAATGRWRARERWSAELAAVVSPAPGDWAAQADVGLMVAEPHELRLGVVLLGGPAGSLGGEYRANDFAYVEYRAVW